MNFWGFHPAIFGALEDYLDRFLKNLAPGDLKSECLLPALVDERIRGGALSVDVLHTDARWFGMTYKEDHPLVQAEIARLHERALAAVSEVVSGEGFDLLRNFADSLLGRTK